ncbi:hypothetical protein D1007_47014 [Hordeum vulgare]|nr:hypothetical protein D1007_47014 [Hordeum vulgare]
MMKEGINESSIPEEHGALLSAVLKIIRSIDNRLKEDFDGLLTCFKASSSAAAPNSAELAEMNRKLKSSEEEVDLLNERFDDAHVIAAEVEKIKVELSKARQEAAEPAAAAKNASAELLTVSSNRQTETWDM